MDIFSHGLWASAGARIINIKSERKLNFWRAAFWGIFPDLFAFIIPFAWMIFQLLSGDRTPTFRPPQDEPVPPNRHWTLELASQLYNVSHSVVIFIAVFVVVFFLWRYLLGRRAPIEIFGWLLHIFMDIPTHSYRFFPTPVFWPLFGWKFDGTSWATPQFLVINFSFLIIVYFFLWFYKKRKSNSQRL